MAATRVPPASLIRAVDRVRDGLGRLRRRSAPGPAVLLELILGAWVSQGITVAADLKIADALADGPLRTDELAKRVGADPDALARLMRALVSAGVFTVRRGRYALNPVGMRSIRSPMRYAPMRRCRSRRWPGSWVRPSTVSTGPTSPRRSAPGSR